MSSDRVPPRLAASPPSLISRYSSAAVRRATKWNHGSRKHLPARSSTSASTAASPTLGRRSSTRSSPLWSAASRPSSSSWPTRSGASMWIWDSCTRPWRGSRHAAASWRSMRRTTRSSSSGATRKRARRLRTCSTIRSAGPSWPRRLLSGARSRSPRRPARRCTSCIFRPVEDSGPSSKAETGEPPSSPRRVRITSRSPTRSTVSRTGATTR